MDAWQGGGFDLVLMDIDLPVMNGFEALRKIRDGEDGAGMRTPIIAEGFPSPLGLGPRHSRPAGADPSQLSRVSTGAYRRANADSNPSSPKSCDPGAGVAGSGWGGRIRTLDTQDQNLLPYHLATPQGVQKSLAWVRNEVQSGIRFRCKAEFFHAEEIRPDRRRFAGLDPGNGAVSRGGLKGQQDLLLDIFPSIVGQGEGDVLEGTVPLAL